VRPDAGALARARSLTAAGRAAEALALTRALVASAPDDPEALSAHAEALLGAEGPEPALSVYTRAAALAPEHPAGFAGWARCLHDLGRTAEAVAPARRAVSLALSTDDLRALPAAALTLVLCLRELRRYREALAAAEEALARVPDAVLGEWASEIEREWAEAERERC
jgi:tetratricopeptide (TPR) repeat protein